MNKKTGATALVPGSHTKVEEINEYMARVNAEGAAASEADSRLHAFRRFTANGLQPGVVNSVAGDLILFDVSTFHGCCNAAEPDYTTGLLRAICIMAAAPRGLLAPETLYARRRAYELDEFMGGQVGTEEWAERFMKKVEDEALPEVRSLAEASPAVQRLVAGAEVHRPRL
jgi:hypothetical protein